MRVIFPDNSNNEVGFRIDRRQPGGIFAEVATHPASDPGPPDNILTAFDPGPLTETVEYCWRVVAHNAGGESSSEEACHVTDTIPPNAPGPITLEIVLPPEASARPATLPSPPETP
jgi:hypothetical protein